MKYNEQLQREVQDAIAWEPALKDAHIGVTVKEGIIILTGTVDTYAKKQAAAAAAKNVAGVKAVVEKIEIKTTEDEIKNDVEIATAILNALKWNWQVPDECISVMVENGWVRLAGEVQYPYQREAAEKSAALLIGVLGVSNDIVINATIADAVEQFAIQQAFARNWSINKKGIKIKVKGHNVVLSGTVGSVYEREEAGRIASNDPGVWSIDNELLVALVTSNFFQILT